MIETTARKNSESVVVKKPHQRHVLALNGGSSSLKFGLYETSAVTADCKGSLVALASGAVEGIGGDNATRFQVKVGRRKLLIDETIDTATPLLALARIARMLTDSGLPPPDAIGHRVVHGGPSLLAHCQLDARVLKKIIAASTLAPLHAPATLAIIRQSRKLFPQRPQFACFDTAFHCTLPETARRLPLNQALHDAGVRRYGFHGLSCESALRQIGHPQPHRIIIAHLGSGSSVTAVCGGRSVDTSMGMTPGGGVPMASRSGDLDPGVLVYLMRAPIWTAARIEALVDRESGILGISGISGDIRHLQAIAATSDRARLAINIYCTAVSKQVAAMIAVLGGVDLLVFTGGIGEHNQGVRSAICDRLAWFGISLCPQRNADAINPLNAAESRTNVLLISSREEEEIARQTAGIMVV